MRTLLLFALALLAAPVTGAEPMRAQAGREPVLHFIADLRGEHVAPAAVRTGATGRASAILIGNRFTVHGSVAGLSSALRDIQKTPDDPGVHLHRGAPGETTPYFFGLRVRLNADERSGIFWGTAELDEAQRALLLKGRLYVDIHTATHGPGEVRDQWRPGDADAAARALAMMAVLAPAIESAACHTAVPGPPGPAR